MWFLKVTLEAQEIPGECYCACMSDASCVTILFDVSSESNHKAWSNWHVFE